MAVARDKFPFKWMPKVIKVLDEVKKEGLLPLSQISGKIGSCIPDGSEITRMLHYITHFGRVMRLETNEWVMYYPSNNSLPEINFRFRFIEGFVKLLYQLDHNPKKLEEIASALTQSPKDIEDELNFLEEITAKGRVKFDGYGYQQQWYLDPWPEKQKMS